ALREELIKALAAFGQHLAVGAIAAGLDRKHKAFRCFVAPLHPAIGLEGGIICAVDLDRGQFGGGIFQLALLNEADWVEGAAPRLDGPAADTGMGFARHGALLPPRLCSA